MRHNKDWVTGAELDRKLCINYRLRRRVVAAGNIRTLQVPGAPIRYNAADADQLFNKFLSDQAAAVDRLLN